MRDTSSDWHFLQPLFNQVRVYSLCASLFSLNNSIMQKDELSVEAVRKGQVDFTLLKQMLTQDKKPPRNWTKALIQKFLTIVRNQPNIMKLQEPLIIIGDIHGQFFDLLKIISLFPRLDQAPQENFLFLGDYVDRGPQGVEVTLLLMAMKVKYPRKTFLLRGNHQTRQMTQIMNFFAEAKEKYDQDVYFDIMDAFDALPLAAIVNENFFCVHGGITADGEHIDHIQKLNRFDEVPLKGAICDLLWADPTQQEDGSVHNNDKYISNYQRNCSIFFGAEHCRAFLKKHKFMTVIRAHEVQLQGYKQHMWPKWHNIPMVYTVFSAPNYCGSYGNMGAIVTIKNSRFSVRQFKESNPKYYVPPKFNAFNFSLPKLYTLLDQIIKRITKKYGGKLIPELRKATPEQIIAMYVGSQHGNHMVSSINKAPSTKEINLKEEKELRQEDIFLRSSGYFMESEKRPQQLTYKDK